MHKISIFDDALLLYVYWTKYAPKVAVFFPHTGIILIQKFQNRVNIHTCRYIIQSNREFHRPFCRIRKQWEIRMVSELKRTRKNELNISQCDAVPFYFEIDDVLSVSLFKT